jgi:hypothetical protein
MKEERGTVFISIKAIPLYPTLHLMKFYTSMVFSSFFVIFDSILQELFPLLPYCTCN